MSKKSTRQNKRPSVRRDLLNCVDAAQTELLELRSVARMLSRALAIYNDTGGGQSDELIDGLVVVARQVDEKLEKVHDRIDDFWELAKNDGTLESAGAR